MLDAIPLMMSKFKDSSIPLMATDDNFTLVKSKKRKGNQKHKAASKKMPAANETEDILKSKKESIIDQLLDIITPFPNPS